MTIKRGLMGRTSGIPIPVTISLLGKRFNLREFVIQTALESEDRPLKQQEEDKIIEVTRALRTEYPECWKINSETDQCKGIFRAVSILVNLLKRHPIRSRKKEIDDLKRWLEYGRML